jgi:hypothetical protein
MYVNLQVLQQLFEIFFNLQIQKRNTVMRKSLLYPDPFCFARYPPHPKTKVDYHLHGAPTKSLHFHLIEIHPRLFLFQEQK